jgi:hypothetical protein
MAIQISEKSNRWRDAYNPLRGLSMPRLVSLLEAGERGQYADLQWFYHYMERSDAMVSGTWGRILIAPSETHERRSLSETVDETSRRKPIPRKRNR